MTDSIAFAPIGLLDMFNSGAAVEQFEVYNTSITNDDTEISTENRSPVAKIALRARGCGRFGVYCSQRPLSCTVDNVETEFNYEAASGLATLMIPVPKEEMYRWSIEIQV